MPMMWPWRSTGADGRGPRDAVNGGWPASTMTSRTSSGRCSRRHGAAARTAARPRGRCSVTACSRSRAVGATRSTTSPRPAGRATRASATTRSPRGCDASAWTREHSSSAMRRFAPASSSAWPAWQAIRSGLRLRRPGRSRHPRGARSDPRSVAWRPSRHAILIADHRARVPAHRVGCGSGPSAPHRVVRGRTGRAPIPLQSGSSAQPGRPNQLAPMIRHRAGPLPDRRHPAEQPASRTTEVGHCADRRDCGRATVEDDHCDPHARVLR